MAKFILSDLTINIDIHNNNVNEFLEIIKPSWNLNDVQKEPFSGGYSGRLILCYQRRDPEDALIIRLRNPSSRRNENELKLIQILSTEGHFSEILAIFKNGYCYKYIEGNPVINVKERTGTVDKEMLSCIAKEIAYFHSIKLENVDYSRTDSFDSWKSTIRKFNFLHHTKPNLSKEVILREVDLISEFIQKKNPRIVQCHGDCHPGNFIWNKNTSKLTIIDWENTYAGYQLQEIAHIFLSMSKLGIEEPNGINETKESAVPEDYKRLFFTSYLETWYKLNNEMKLITKADIESWLTELEPFGLMSPLQYIIECLALPESVEEFSGNRLKFLATMIDVYLDLKQKFLGKNTFETIS